MGLRLMTSSANSTVNQKSSSIAWNYSGHRYSVSTPSEPASRCSSKEAAAVCVATGKAIVGSSNSSSTLEAAPQQPQRSSTPVDLEAMRKRLEAAKASLAPAPTVVPEVDKNAEVRGPLGGAWTRAQGLVNKGRLIARWANG